MMIWQVTNLYLSNNCTFHSLRWSDENLKIIAIKVMKLRKKDTSKLSPKIWKKVRFREAVSTACRLKTWSQAVLFIYVIHGKNLIKKSWNLSEFGLWRAVLHTNGTDTQKKSHEFLSHFHCDEFSLQRFVFIVMNSLRWQVLYIVQVQKTSSK